INNARCSNRKKGVAFFCGVDRFFERINRKHLAKPNHVWPQIAAARSTSTEACPEHSRRVDIEVVARAIVLKTSKAMQISMQLDNSFAAGARVKPVHVLGDEQEFRRAFLHFRQREVSSIWFRFECVLAPRSIPIPNEYRISPNRFRGRQLFRLNFATKPS